MDGWMDGQTDGGTDRWMDLFIYLLNIISTRRSVEDNKMTHSPHSSAKTRGTYDMVLVDCVMMADEKVIVIEVMEWKNMSIYNNNHK